MINSSEIRERRFLTRRGLARRYGVDTSSVDRWLRNGTLPPPLRPGGPGGIMLWPEDVIEQHELVDGAL
jgi:predicted DNA-binding transcriptional regulator AlpA